MNAVFQRTKVVLKLLTVGLALVTATAQAVGGVTPFSDPASFTTKTTYTFNEFDPGFGLDVSFFGDPVTVTASGVSLKADESKVFGLSTVGYLSDIVYSGKSGDTVTIPNTVTATLTGNIKAIGFYVGSFNYPGTSFSVIATSQGTDYDLGTFTLPAVANTFGFVGFSSSQAISKIVFGQESPTNAFDIQKFVVGSVTPVPEPGMPMLLGAGLALLAVARRRRQS